MTKKMNNKGFSLVELIIVIAIMAVLIGVLAPQFIKYVERSRNSTDIQNAEEIRDALQAYHVDTMKSGSDLASTGSVTVGTSTACSGAGVADALSDAGIANGSCKSKQKWTSYVVSYSMTGDNLVFSYADSVFAAEMNK